MDLLIRRPDQSLRPPHRPDIDVLRAFALIFVVLFHAWPQVAPGGYIGVDIFLVLSGFVITQAAWPLIQCKAFTLSDFYVRRVRRLLPAFLAVATFSLVAGWMVLLPFELEMLGVATFSAALGASNLVFANYIDYFSPGSDFGPALHFWSLSLEIQFYAIFPIILLAMSRTSPAVASASLALFAAASFAYAAVLTGSRPQASFFLLPSRAWEFSAGGCLALLFQIITVRRSVVATLRWAKALALAGLAVTVAEDLPGQSHPGWSTLIPVGATLILLIPLARHERGFINLEWLARIGAASYSTYLWHLPLLHFAKAASPDPLNCAEVAVAVTASFVLGHLTWILVERPTRRRRARWDMPLGATALLAVCAVALGFAASGGMASRLPQASLAQFAASDQWTEAALDCHYTEVRQASQALGCLHHADGQSTALTILGDSHALSLVPGLLRAAPEKPLRQLTGNGCPPVINAQSSLAFSYCDALAADLIEAATHPSAPPVVILHARWSEYMSGAFDNQDGGNETDQPNIVTPSPASAEVTPGMSLASAYVQTADILLSAGKTVVLVYPVPEMGWHVPNRLARASWLWRGASVHADTRIEVYDDRHRDITAAFDALPQSSNLIRVRPRDILCSDDTRTCRAELNGLSIYSDDDHLSLAGSEILADHIIDAINGR